MTVRNFGTVRDAKDVRDDRAVRNVWASRMSEL